MYLKNCQSKRWIDAIHSEMDLLNDNQQEDEPNNDNENNMTLEIYPVLKQIITEEETFRIFYANIDTIWEINFLNSSFPVLTAFCSLIKNYKAFFFFFFFFSNLYYNQ